MIRAAPVTGSSPSPHDGRRHPDASPPPPAGDAVVTDIAGGPLAANTARRLVRGFAPEMSQDSLDDALLVVSELVNNCVEHGGGGSGGFVRLAIELSEGVLKVEIVDSGPGFAPPASLAFDDLKATSGRGLRIVAALADRWGITTSEGTHVWVELAAMRVH